MNIVIKPDNSFVEFEESYISCEMISSLFNDEGWYKQYRTKDYFFNKNPELAAAYYLIYSEGVVEPVCYLSIADKYRSSYFNKSFDTLEEFNRFWKMRAFL